MINYCKKHDEQEPWDNEGVWVCPRCSKSNKNRFLTKEEIDEIVEYLKEKHSEK